MPAILAVTAALTLGASACGESGGGGGGSQSTPPPEQQSQGQSTKPVAEVPDVSGQDTSVTLSEDFTGALEKLEVTPAPVGDAEISDDGEASFPITGGNVKYFEPGTVSPFVQGELMHKGSGLSLTAGDTEVELEDFVVNPANSKLTATVSANGEVAAENAELFFLNGSTLKPLKTKGDQAILQGTEVTLTEDAAKLLNKTFEVDAFEKGLPIGEAKITLDTK